MNHHLALRSTLFPLILLGVLATGLCACPASYVKGLGNDTSNPLLGKANEVADGYMDNRGLDPASPVGDVVRPFVAGTAIYEGVYSPNRAEFDLPNGAVGTLVTKALGPNAGQRYDWSRYNQSEYNYGHGMIETHAHFDMHFGHGLMDGGGYPGENNEVEPREVTVLGG